MMSLHKRVIALSGMSILLLILAAAPSSFGQSNAAGPSGVEPTATDGTQKQPPNIIVMYSDDHAAQSIGAYQDALNYGLKLGHTPTPNIDRLAEEGMRFDNALATTMDLYATFLGLADVPLPKDRIIDGIDLMPVLTGQKEQVREGSVLLSGSTVIRRSEGTVEGTLYNAIFICKR